MTANQLYKQSGSEKPFKQWLRDQQRMGRLEDRAAKNFYSANATHVVDNVTSKQLITIAVILAAAYYIYKKSK